MKCRIILYRLVEFVGKHTLTKESQEVMVGLRDTSAVPGLSLSLIPRTSTFHSGQLNITTSTLSTPMTLLKSKLVPKIDAFSVSS